MTIYHASNAEVGHPMLVESNRMLDFGPVKAFLAPADTFDNVKGQFPIGFRIWRTASATAAEKDGRVASMRRPQAAVAAASSRPPCHVFSERFRRKQHERRELWYNIEVLTTDCADCAD